jgi:cyclopropane fatty-acyl-phospholipid synthase-like methyltransferase
MRRYLWTLKVALLAAAACGQQLPEVPINTPYVTTPPEVVRAMLSLAAVGRHDVVYDLGCGDGRIVIAAARDFGARGVGIEISPEHTAEARAKARRAGVARRVEIRQQDLFDTDLSPATVVAIYLLPEVNLRLRPKLLKELKPGARVVSHSFHMGDWKPAKVVEAHGTKIYLWIVPLRI